MNTTETPGQRRIQELRRLTADLDADERHTLNAYLLGWLISETADDHWQSGLGHAMRMIEGDRTRRAARVDAS